MDGEEQIKFYGIHWKLITEVNEKETRLAW